jgi:hypothetical protein
MVFSSVFSGVNMLRFMQSSKNHDLTQLLYPQYITVISCCLYWGVNMLRFAGGRAAALFFAILGWFLHTIITSDPCARSYFFPYGGHPGNLVFFLSSSFFTK